MLKLILGRARTGKTTYLFDRIRQQGPYRPQVLLVPEQVSHDMERLLCAHCGSGASRYAEILSFTRLAQRVFTRAGGLAQPQLDKGGRLLLMSQAVAAVSSQLRVYGRPSKKAAFLQQLLATADEIKSYCVQPEELVSAGREQGGEEGDRLWDLGLILGAYQALTMERAADPRDRLTRLNETLKDCQWFRGKDIYLDSFADFTPQQRQIIGRMLTQARSVTVAITCDRLEGSRESVFDVGRRTAHTLMELARERNCGVEYQVLTERKDGAEADLIHLEKELFAQCSPAEERARNIRVYPADSTYDEVEWTAGEILRLVREKGWHFRDIAVSARTMGTYEEALETVFRRYQIPLFLGRVEPVLEKPILTLLTGALDIIRGGYEYEDIFRYLKTGLAGLDWEEIDQLENYVLRWDIRGSRWTRREPWSWNPRGYVDDPLEEDQRLLDQLDQLRRKITAPLLRLSAHKTGTGLELSQALYQLLEDIDLPQRLTHRANELREEGELQQAEEYRQLWEILIQALEQCAQLLEGQSMELDYFADLFRLVLSQYSVGAIPVSLDRVIAGEMARLSHVSCKALFLLGVDDEQFPLVSQSPGLLTDEDRALLTARGMELAPSADLRLDREQTMAYDILTRPNRLLTLSWPRQAGGGQKRPAVLLQRLEEMYGGLHRGEKDELCKLMAPLPALELGARRMDGEILDRLARQSGWEDIRQRVERAASAQRGSLSPAGVHDLYGSRIPLSASKMDKLKSCHFAYFCQYGLRAQPRRKAGLDAPETGTFVHYVLENVLKQGSKLPGGLKQLCDRDRKELMERYVEEYIRTKLGGLEDQTPRFRYLFRRLLKSVEIILQNVVEELQSGRFEPINFELGFGRGQELPPIQIQAEDITLSISGFVDRIDGYEKDGRLYLRVVDYKTGRKSFSLTDVWHGLSLQMLIYLFTLQKWGEDYYGKPVAPAGVLYLPARDVLLTGRRQMPESERLKAADKALCRSGLLLRDEEILWAMEQWGESGPRFLPLRVSKKGAISGDCLATAEQWGRLSRRLDDILLEMGQEIRAGNVDADPWQKGGGQRACDWCEYAQACHFEEGQGSDRCRYLYSVSGEEFWRSKEGED